VVEAIASGRRVYQSLERTIRSIQRYPGTLIVTSDGHAVVSHDGKPWDIRFHFVVVWVRTPDGWKMASYVAAPPLNR
jgi:hypothetical protein